MHQLLFSVNMHHWLHTFSPHDSGSIQRSGASADPQNSNLLGPHCLVIGCWSQRLRWIRSCQGPSRYRSIPSFRFLRWAWMFVFHQLSLDDNSVCLFGRSKQNSWHITLSFVITYCCITKLSICQADQTHHVVDH